MSNQQDQITEVLGNYSKYLTQLQDWAVAFVPRFFMALAILWIGFKVVKKLNILVAASLKKANIARETSSFLESIIDIIFKLIVLLVAAGMFGFEVSSLIGVLAAAGFAVGLALQGFLGNFAAGMTIVFFKPYKVGDWVEISEKFGKIDSIEIFNTIIITPGNKTLIIPNGQVTDNIITNFSTMGHIWLELNVTMPYAESFPKVKQVIKDALVDHPLILKEPEPVIGIESYDSHSVVISIRPFIKPDDYWEATFDIYEKIKEAFSKNSIQVAYSEGVELGKIGD
ncbi:MAG: small conductance mechanosensitive channel [Maribacter sp.]|jgi:small conductance mechanosensitive channel